ncbi:MULTISPECIES: hypothetical protein [Aerosakkonema]
MLSLASQYLARSHGLCWRFVLAQSLQNCFGIIASSDGAIMID